MSEPQPYSGRTIQNLMYENTILAYIKFDVVELEVLVVEANKNVGELQ